MAKSDYSAGRYWGSWVDDDSEPMRGFSNGATWNGWQCPVFTRQEIEVAIADRRLDTFSTGGSFDCFYDEKRDAFVMVEPDDQGCVVDRELSKRNLEASVREFEVGEFLVSIKVCEGMDIVVDGETHRVYSIGGYSWCWEKAPEPSNDETRTSSFRR